MDDAWDQRAACCPSTSAGRCKTAPNIVLHSIGVYFFHLILLSQGGFPLGLKTTVPRRGGEMGADGLWGNLGQPQANAGR